MEFSDRFISSKKTQSIIDSVDRYVGYFSKTKKPMPFRCHVFKAEFDHLQKILKQYNDDHAPERITRNGVELVRYG